MSYYPEPPKFPSMLFVTIWVLLLLLVLTSCEKKEEEIVTEKIVPQFSREDKPVEITVKFFKSEKIMRRHWKAEFGEDISPLKTDRVYGKSKTWIKRQKMNNSAIRYIDTQAVPKCTVYVMRPESVDDERTLTLGHEVLHCFYGNYHEEVT